MDPITHTMAGAAMARAGLDRRTPLATATLVLAANAPDLDVFMMFAGSYPTLAFRRGWTHGPLAIALLPFFVAAAMILWDRRVRRRREPAARPVDERALLLLAGIGVLSHPLLDWLNTYGIRLLMPFSGRWFHGDAVFIVDPWLWLLLGAALFLPRRTVRRVRILGGVAVAYILAMVVLSRASESVGRTAAAAEGIVGIAEVLFQPALADPFSGQLIVVTPDAYHLGRFGWFGKPWASFGDTVPRGPWADDVVIRAQQDAGARDFLTWARLPYAAIDTAGGRTAVIFRDIRFRDSVTGGGLEGIRVEVAP